MGTSGTGKMKNPKLSRILLLFVSGFSFLTSWIGPPLFRYSHRIVEAQKGLAAAAVSKPTVA
jgi:hypothetical protein